VKQLSISFTIGKASIPKQANLEHNNREYIAKNVDGSKTKDNITYKKEDVEDAYNKLFGQALSEYNAKQKRKDRKIENYYDHISNGNREEAFYEAIVQYGDNKTSPCGSSTGEECKIMLDEFMRDFIKRNPNLYVFNAVMHNDEASPHLHINFVPFYTKGRKNGLSKGVSMKAALDEQGFTAKNFKENRLVAWEENERAAMEKILNAHGMEREDKNATYTHMTVEEYKRTQDEKKIIAALRKQKNISETDLKKESVIQLRNKISSLEKENKNLTEQKHSPYKSFFYSDPEKQSYVQSKLDLLDISYRETENGFEAQEYLVDRIRIIEKEYVPKKTTARDRLREDIDRLLVQSKDIDELLNKLEEKKYSIKHGKYISVKPIDGERFIRLKSLGENYSEFALRNRINAMKKYEGNLQNKIINTEKDTPEFYVLRSMQFYIIAFKRNALPMNKLNIKKPFMWTNDKELDKLTALNAKINSGATLESIREEFHAAEQNLSEKENDYFKAKKDLVSYYELKEKIGIVYEGRVSEKYTREQALQTLSKFPSINEKNYKKIDTLIDNQRKALSAAEKNVQAARSELSAAADSFSTMEKIMGGTYVQSLAAAERDRREAEIIPNGLKNS
jgi:hypothetical protein